MKTFISVIHKLYLAFFYTLSKKFIFFFFILILISQAFAKRKSDPVLDFAKQQVEQKYYKPALSTINSYMETHKNDVEALYWKALCFYKLENYIAATENYNLVLKLNPSYYPACMDMANMLTKQKKFEEAIPYYNTAISVHDSDVNLINSRGMCYYYADMFEPALKDFKRVLKLDPNNYLAYNNKGSATYNNQNIASASVVDLRSAEKDFNKAIELKPDFELAFRNRGIVRYYLDDLDASYKDLLRASQLDDKDENAQYYLGKVLYKRKNYEVALQFFDNAIRLVNYKSDFFIDRGMCKLEMENFQGARADFYKAMQLTNDRGYAEYQTARSYAAEASKKDVFVFLRAAKKSGLFKDTRYFTYIAKDKYFVGWAKDKEFMDLIQELKFGKK